MCDSMQIAEDRIRGQGGMSFDLYQDYAVYWRRTMEERDFFDERAEPRTHQLTCPFCGKADEYQLNWLVRRKKKQLNGRADERDRARFAKAQSYMVLRDDIAMCKNIRCRKRFELSGVKTMAFLD
jgi:hypothetical protein